MEQGIAHQLFRAPGRAASLALTAYWLIEQRGLALPSLRSIAQAARISPSTVSRDYADPGLAPVLGAETAQARVRALGRPRVAAVLRTEAQVRDERVWQAWLQMGRTDSGIGLWTAWALEHRRKFVAYLLSFPDEVVIDTVEALSIGLAARQADRVDALTPDRAERAFDLVISALGLDGARLR